jgi:organic radical activating enzyme
MKYSFEFNITSFCQAKCASCERTIQIGNFTPTHYPVERFEKTLENLSSVNIDMITLCGEWGDPMMHPNIEDIIKLCTNKGYNVELMTNGGIRTTKFYERLAKEHPKLSMFFCIDGLDHDTNWKYREGVDWQKAWDNMHSWFGNGGKGQWEMLIFTWNQHQIEDARKHAIKNRIDLNFKINTRKGFPGVIVDEQRKAVSDRLKEIYMY